MCLFEDFTWNVTCTQETKTIIHLILVKKDAPVSKLPYSLMKLLES